MRKNENIPRKRGKRLKKDEVKTEIIRYILSKNGVVSGPDIIKYLREKSTINILDEKNIRNHLNELQKQHCIEKIPGKPGLENKWKIEKIENLLNTRTHYSNVKLNNCGKSVDIVYEDQSSNGYFFGDYFIYPKNFRVQLLLSPSFFEACLDNDIKTLYDKAYEYYKYGEGFEECKHIQNCIGKFYNECIKSITISPKNWLNAYNKDTSNFSELGIYQNITKNLPSIKISEETFREILEDSDMWRFDSNDWESRFVGEFSIKLADMVFRKMQEKNNTESRKRWEKELREKSISILREMLEELPSSIVAPTTNPVLIERFEEIYSLRVGLGKEEEPYIMKFIRETVEKLQAEEEAPTTNPVPNEGLSTNPVLAERLESALRQVQIEEEYDISKFISLRELSAKTTYEIFQQMFKYIPMKFLDTPEMPKILIEILKKVSQEVLQGIQVLPDEMYELLTEITIHRMKTAYSINEIMFKHYFDRDIEDGNISPNEREYVVKMKELHSEFVKGKISSRDAESILDDFLELILKDAGNT